MAVEPESRRQSEAPEVHAESSVLHSQSPFPPAPQTPAAPDLDRLTDHVMREFDRRLIAWRERMGRV